MAPDRHVEHAERDEVHWRLAWYNAQRKVSGKILLCSPVEISSEDGNALLNLVGHRSGKGKRTSACYLLDLTPAGSIASIRVTDFDKKSFVSFRNRLHCQIVVHQNMNFGRKAWVKSLQVGYLLEMWDRKLMELLMHFFEHTNCSDKMWELQYWCNFMQCLCLVDRYCLFLIQIWTVYYGHMQEALRKRTYRDNWFSWFKLPLLGWEAALRGALSCLLSFSDFTVLAGKSDA